MSSYDYIGIINNNGFSTARHLFQLPSEMKELKEEVARLAPNEDARNCRQRAPGAQ